VDRQAIDDERCRSRCIVGEQHRHVPW
jgi:hypothetical protein